MNAQELNVHESRFSNAVPHVLILPSEQFQPPESHLAGIFQLHQARILRDLGYSVGVISIAQEFSIPMIGKAIASKACGRQHDRVPNRSLLCLFGLLWSKIARVKDFIREEQIEGIPVCRIDGFYFLPPHPGRNHFGWVKAGLAAFDRYRHQHGTPDLIHAHNCDSAGLLARQIKRKHGVPYVITEHSSYLHRGLIPKSMYPRLAESIRDADAMLVVSPTLKKAIRAKLGSVADQAQYLPNVIDPEMESLPLVADATAPPPTRFLAIGDLIKLKGHENLIRAFAASFGHTLDSDSTEGTAGKRSLASLTIAGDGPEQTNLSRLIDELNLSNQVNLLGRISRQQVVEELDACHCLVLPSEFETFGVVLIEALSRGKPVIATACGGPEAVVNDDVGMLVPVRDQDSLATALTKMVSDLPQYSADQVRQSVIDRFGKAAFAESIQRVYDQVFSKGS